MGIRTTSANGWLFYSLNYPTSTLWRRFLEGEGLSLRLDLVEQHAAHGVGGGEGHRQYKEIIRYCVVVQTQLVNQPRPAGCEEGGTGLRRPAM